MKKNLLILSTVTAVFLASCGGEGGNSLTQEQIDSIANQKIADSLEAIRIADSIRVADSLLADSIRIADSLEVVRIADSIATVKAGKKYVAPKKAPAVTNKIVPETTTGAAVEQPKVRTEEEISRDKKKAKFGDQDAQQRLEQDSRTKKEAKFGNAAAQQSLEDASRAKKEAKFNNN